MKESYIDMTDSKNDKVALCAHTNEDQHSQRNSGVELLKIIAMMMIVLFHVVQTLTSDPSDNISFQDYVIHIGNSTEKVQYIVLALISYFGSIGNMVFFACSAWFLLDQNRNVKQKILQILLDVWVVSVSVLIIVLILRRGQLNGSLVLQQLFPTLFGNNWYMTCYVLFLGLYPFLNRIIRQISQRTHLRISIVLFFLYSVCRYVNPFINHFFEASGFFFSSKLIVWTMIYFMIAYMKLYMPKTAGNGRTNRIFLAIGLCGWIGTVLLTNVLGRKIPLLDGMLMVWNTDSNPFILLMVIAAFNLFRNRAFTNQTINYVSKLTLFIYILHENLLLRRLYRPAMWQYVYLKFGYSQVLLLALCLAAIIFVFALVASMLYYHTLHKLVVKACAWLYGVLRRTAKRMEKSLLRVS